MITNITVLTVGDFGEVGAGTDLAAALAPQVEDGDILVITSKIVSKAEGRVLELDKAAAVLRETDREVARRGGTRVVRNRLGLTLAGAGVDASNVAAGSVVLLPVDPDDSARRIREALPVNAAVIVSDTAGRAWRHGQTDIAIGAAGIEVAHDYAGRTDQHGNELAVTLPAVADELAGAADLVKGKLTGRPVAVVRGLGHLVLPPGRHGPGAATLVREEATDMFGYGAREAVLHALLRDEHRGFGAPAPAETLIEALESLRATAWIEAGRVCARSDDDRDPEGRNLVTAAYAYGWELAEETAGSLRFAPRAS